jgi:hypothetical protein
MNAAATHATSPPPAALRAPRGDGVFARAARRL